MPSRARYSWRDKDLPTMRQAIHSHGNLTNLLLRSLWAESKAFALITQNQERPGSLRDMRQGLPDVQEFNGTHLFPCLYNQAAKPEHDGPDGTEEAERFAGTV
jgi:hypothetical protein